MEKIFTISLLTEKLQVVEHENEVYVCIDPETFLQKASFLQKRKQAVLRVIGSTFFTFDNHYHHNPFIKIEPAVNERLKDLGVEVVEDKKIIDLIALMAGADNADTEKFADIIGVEKWEELKDLRSDLSFGLGFPGKGVSLLVTKHNGGYMGTEKKVYLQILHSYTEGYSVEHQELTPELLAFSKLDKVTSNFE